jgi:hypothetical protein
MLLESRLACQYNQRFVVKNFTTEYPAFGARRHW